MSLVEIEKKKNASEINEKGQFSKGQIISECPLEILDFPKIPRKI